MRKYSLKSIAATALVSLFLMSSLANAAGLVDMVTGQLGVSPSQAEGGLGALLRTAKGSMGDDQYGSLLSMVPGLDGLVDQAPALGGGSSGLGGLASSAGQLLGGGSGDSLAGMGQLTQAFDSLGLSSDMVGSFSKLLLDYVQNEGGSQAFELLKGALPI
ncbi:MAG: DUF2780 domain-containing protein [Chromatiaceae bacterium]|nr:DUF2780 domain-containing protein [Chromatiaceae bacterium]MCP5315018.1 DUF2780 domain-containing protein [Chromatiaceae bacterium]